MANKRKRYSLKHRTIEVKIQICKNRIKALEYDVKKKELIINDLKDYLKNYLQEAGRVI